MSRLALAAALAAIAASACSGSSAAPALHDASTHDAPRGVDAPHEASSHGRDSGTDAERDAGREASHDASSTVGAALCGDCVSNKCMPSGRDCENDATCAMWLACAGACLESPAPSAACLAACDQTYGDAGALFRPVYACMCADCDTLCAAVKPCAAGGDGGA